MTLLRTVSCALAVALLVSIVSAEDSSLMETANPQQECLDCEDGLPPILRDALTHMAPMYKPNMKRMMLSDYVDDQVRLGNERAKELIDEDAQLEHLDDTLAYQMPDVFTHLDFGFGRLGDLAAEASQQSHEDEDMDMDFDSFFKTHQKDDDEAGDNVDAVLQRMLGPKGWGFQDERVVKTTSRFSTSSSSSSSSYSSSSSSSWGSESHHSDSTDGSDSKSTDSGNGSGNADNGVGGDAPDGIDKLAIDTNRDEDVGPKNNKQSLNSGVSRSCKFGRRPSRTSTNSGANSTFGSGNQKDSNRGHVSNPASFTVMLMKLGSKFGAR